MSVGIEVSNKGDMWEHILLQTIGFINDYHYYINIYII